MLNGEMALHLFAVPRGMFGLPALLYTEEISSFEFRSEKLPS